MGKVIAYYLLVGVWTDAATVESYMEEPKKLSQNYNDPAMVSNQRTAPQRCFHICFYCYVINNS